MKQSEQILCQIKSKNGNLNEFDQEMFFTRVPSIGEKICISGPLGGVFLVQDVMHYASHPRSNRGGCFAVIGCIWIGDNVFV